MLLTFHKKPNNVEQWLAIATRGLCNDAKERIGEEVREHVQEMLADYAAQDVPMDSALDMALNRLGSPSEARRGYRRKHLSNHEFQFLDAFDVASQESFPRKASGYDIILYIWIGVLIFVAWRLISSGYEFGWQTWNIAALLTSNVFLALPHPVSHFFKRRFGRRVGFTVYIAALTFALDFMIVACGFLGVNTYRMEPVSDYSFTLLVIGLGGAAFLPLLTYEHFRVWRKIRPLLSD